MSFYRWGKLTHQETSCPRSQAEAELESRQSDVRAPLPPAYNHQDLRLNIVLMWVEPTGPFFHAFFLYLLFIVVVTVTLTYYLIKLLRRSHFGKMCSAVKAFSLPPSLSPHPSLFLSFKGERAMGVSSKNGQAPLWRDSGGGR